MFTFRPPSKNGNGHKNENGNGNGVGNGNGHAQANDHAAVANGNGNGNGNGHAHSSPNALSWLGLGGKTAAPRVNGNGNGNGHGYSNKIESVLGPGIHLKGDLSGIGGVRIEGTFDGHVNVKGTVVIADGAKVTADIEAGVVTVAGSLKGNVTAGKVEIRATGRIWGDLVTSAFATEEGAFLRGQVRMEDDVLQPGEAAAQLEPAQPVEL